MPNPKGINQYTKGRGRGSAPKLRRTSEQRASYAASLVGAPKTSKREKDAKREAGISKRSADAMRRREANAALRKRGKLGKIR